MEYDMMVSITCQSTSESVEARCRKVKQASRLERQEGRCDGEKIREDWSRLKGKRERETERKLKRDSRQLADMRASLAFHPIFHPVKLFYDLARVGLLVYC